MKKSALVLAALAVAVMASACVTTRADTPAARMPALDVPPVPPRVIEPAPPPPAPMPEPVEPLPKEVPPSAAKQKPQPRENQKPDPKPPETATVEPVPQTAVTNVAPPVLPLRTSRTGDTAQAERRIKDTLYRANDLLSKVDYQKLTAERQKAYNMAKQFIQGAETAISDGKFEYALELAEKAETFAKELQG